MRTGGSKIPKNFADVLNGCSLSPRWDWRVRATNNERTVDATEEAAASLFARIAKKLFRINSLLISTERALCPSAAAL